MIFNLTKASDNQTTEVTKDIEIGTLEELLALVQEYEAIIVFSTSTIKTTKDGHLHYEKVDKPTICIYDDYVE